MLFGCFNSKYHNPENLVAIVGSSSCKNNICMSWTCNQYNNDDRINIDCLFQSNNNYNRYQEVCVKAYFYSNTTNKVVASNHTPICSGWLKNTEYSINSVYIPKTELAKICGSDMKKCNMLVEKSE